MSGFSFTDVADRLFSDEGFVPHVYEDSKGFLTIGPGILVDKRRGGGITLDEGRYLLMNRIVARTAEVRDRFPWWKRLNAARQQIIVCMAYQLGTNGVANFKRMVTALERGDFVTAAAEMLDSNWAREDAPERAKRMANMMERGDWR